MKRYSIKDIEMFTGIKAHTLRIWEQRYSLFNPERSDTNIRYYTNEDVRKALNINFLYKHGWKISRIASLSDGQMKEEVEAIIQSMRVDELDNVEIFVRHIVDYNEGAIKQQLHDLCDVTGLEAFFTDTLIPLLTKIGDLWQIGAISVSHEHFFSNILRDFILRKISDLPKVPEKTQKVVLFLHENEIHELSLLFYNYCLKKSGFDCYYLGASVPFNDLRRFVKQIKPDLMVTSLIASIEKKNYEKIFYEIDGFFDLSKLYVGGFQTKIFQKETSEGVVIINGINDLPKIV